MPETIIKVEDIASDETLINARFAEIVASIEVATTQLAPEDMYVIENTPLRKPGGTSDQGYRYG